MVLFFNGDGPVAQVRSGYPYVLFSRAARSISPDFDSSSVLCTGFSDAILSKCRSGAMTGCQIWTLSVNRSPWPRMNCRSNMSRCEISPFFVRLYSRVAPRLLYLQCLVEKIRRSISIGKEMRLLVNDSAYLVLSCKQEEYRRGRDGVRSSGQIQPYPGTHQYLVWRFSQRYPGQQNVATRSRAVSAMPDATVEGAMIGD